MKTNRNDQATHPKVDTMAAGAHEAVDWAADATNHATDSLSDKGHELRAIEEKWLANVSEYVQKNPTTSLGIALASGYLISRIFSSR